MKFTKLTGGHGADSLIPLWNGTHKRADCINAGDILISDTGQPTTVLSTHICHEPLYKVTPAQGHSFFIGASHSLYFQNCRARRNSDLKHQILCISEYERFYYSTTWRRQQYLLHRLSKVDFNNTLSLDSDPYNFNWESCHHPEELMTGPEPIRLELLAGFLDRHAVYCKYKNIFLYSPNFGKTTTAITLLAQSLGFNVSERPNRSKKIQSETAFVIIGYLNRIPSRKYHCRTKEINKDHTRCSIKIERAGVGTTYGFTVDGSNRYCDDQLFIHSCAS